MPGGQPTKYNNETVYKAQAYLEDEDTFIPNVAELSRVLNVSRATIYNWGNEHPEFFDMLAQIQSEQERRLLKHGLQGDYNPTIAKLMLAKHGYHDKQDNTHAGADGGPVQVIERRIIDPAD